MLNLTIAVWWWKIQKLKSCLVPTGSFNSPKLLLDAFIIPEGLLVFSSCWNPKEVATEVTSLPAIENDSSKKENVLLLHPFMGTATRQCFLDLGWIFLFKIIWIGKSLTGVLGSLKFSIVRAMFSPESYYPTTAGLEYFNTAETHNKDLKKGYMKTIEIQKIK